MMMAGLNPAFPLNMGMPTGRPAADLLHDDDKIPKEKETYKRDDIL